MNFFYWKFSDKRNYIYILIFFCVFISYSYFFSLGIDNQNAKIDPILSFVEPGSSDFLTFRIDRFVDFKNKRIDTIDFSCYDGHFYSNKAPGSIILGIPFYAVLYMTESAIGIKDSFHLQITNAYLLNLYLSVFFISFAMIFFCKTLELLGNGIKKSVFLTLVLAFSTALFPYSSQLWGHSTATAFVIFAIYNLVKSEKRNIFFCGFFIGIAVLTEHLLVLLAVIFGIYILFKNKKYIFSFISGGLFPLAILLLYNYYCFDNPFVTAIKYTNPEFIDNNKFMGIFGTLSVPVFIKLLFSLKRGMFIFSPVLILSIPGFIKFVRNKKDSALAVLCISSILSILTANASFNGWHGGATVCARYLIATLPFWIILTAGLKFNVKMKIVSLILALLSFVNMFVISSTHTIVPEKAENPLYENCYKKFISGEINSQYIVPLRLQMKFPEWKRRRELSAWNSGKICGLEGHISLIPFIIILLAFLYLIYVELKTFPKSQT